MEKKFLYNDRPDAFLTLLQKTTVYRHYLSVEPEVRINRRVFDTGEYKCNLTVKSNETFLRKEIRIPLTIEQYQTIAEIIQFAPLVFAVYEYTLDNLHRISFKECYSMPTVKFAEVEFQDEADYQQNIPIIAAYPFLQEDITEDARYYVRNIWIQWCKTQAVGN
jgi:hypothetical protein